MRLDDLDVPATPACRAALEVATAYCSPALLNHSARAYLWAAGYGLARGIPFDAELLYVSAMLHDLALVTEFDNHTLPFEEAGEVLREHPARLRRKDGSLRHVLIDSSVLWEGDRFVHTRCFTRDVTERGARRSRRGATNCSPRWRATPCSSCAITDGSSRPTGPRRRRTATPTRSCSP